MRSLTVLKTKGEVASRRLSQCPCRSRSATWLSRLTRALEGKWQVVAQLGGFFHSYRSETEAKQAAVFLSVSQDRREYVVAKVETGDGLLERIVFVHRNDVLKTEFRGGFRADL